MPEIDYALRWVGSYLKEGHIFYKSEHDEHDQLCLRVVRAERLQLCHISCKVTNVFGCSFGQTEGKDIENTTAVPVISPCRPHQVVGFFEK